MRDIKWKRINGIKVSEIIKELEKLSSEEIDNNYLGFKKLVESFIRLGDPELCYHLLKNVDRSYLDINRLEKVILDSKNAQYNYYYVRDIDDRNMEKHEKVVIESENPEYNYMFARDIQNANIKDHEEVVLRSENSKYCYNFARKIVGANRYDLEDVILKNRDLEYNYLYAKDIPDAYIEGHQDIIIEERDPYYACLFARDIKNTDMKKLEKVVIRSKDPYYCACFARIYKDADRKKIEEIVLNGNNPRANYIYVDYISDERLVEHLTAMHNAEPSNKYLDELIRKYYLSNKEAIEKPKVDRITLLNSCIR